jgi:hypothetical protein
MMDCLVIAENHVKRYENENKQYLNHIAAINEI